MKARLMGISLIDTPYFKIKSLEDDISHLEDRAEDAENDAEEESERANQAEKAIGWDDKQVESMNSARAAELIVEYWEYITIDDIEELLKRKGAPI